MSKPTRTVSRMFNSPDADIILISSDNHSYAVHKSNLSRSPVFRDMFDLVPGENRLSATGASGEDTERANKRIKLVEGGDALPEIQMHETRELLDRCLPLFYMKEEPNFDSDPLASPRIFSHMELLAASKFVDKYALPAGKVALAVTLPSRLDDLENSQDSWASDVSCVVAALVYVFIAAHFKLRRSRTSALRLLMRIIPLNKMMTGKGGIDGVVRSIDDKCFGNVELARDLIEWLVADIAKVAIARYAVEAEEVSDALTAERTGSRCVHRPQVILIWFESAGLSTTEDVDRFLMGVKLRDWSRCTCSMCMCTLDVIFTAFEDALRKNEKSDDDLDKLF